MQKLLLLWEYVILFLFWSTDSVLIMKSDTLKCVCEDRLPLTNGAKAFSFVWKIKKFWYCQFFFEFLFILVQFRRVCVWACVLCSKKVCMCFMHRDLAAMWKLLCCKIISIMYFRAVLEIVSIFVLCFLFFFNAKTCFFKSATANRFTNTNQCVTNAPGTEILVLVRLAICRTIKDYQKKTKGLSESKIVLTTSKNTLIYLALNLFFAFKMERVGFGQFLLRRLKVGSAFQELVLL